MSAAAAEGASGARQAGTRNTDQRSRVSEDTDCHIIVGHTADTSVRIWVQGSREHPSVSVRVIRCDTLGEATPQQVILPETSDYTACLEFAGLEPSKQYRIEAGFRRGSKRVGRATAMFRTFPTGGSTKEEPFSFLLGSCSLSVVAINNLAVQALQLAGFSLADDSLERHISGRAPPPGERRSVRLLRWAMRQRFSRWLLKEVMKGSLGLVFLGTGGKWPRQPMLKSPYRKIAGMFAGHRVAFVDGWREPRPGDRCVGARSGAIGTVAFDPVLESGTWGVWPGATGFIILTDVSGDFRSGECLLTSDDGATALTSSAATGIASVADASPFRPEGLSPPAFTIHAGDQIYFDFPRYDREPRLDSYRDTYREAWFEDRFERHFLARGAHYMTMDDHEIVDEFASDIQLPRPRRKQMSEAGLPGAARGPAPTLREPSCYLEPAVRAYREYVHSRHPANGEHLFYHFACGNAQFFATDTRTHRRRDQDSRMMDEEQLTAFLKWLGDHPHDLKFVVSSVPFVAEVVAREGSEPGSSREHDKWCGPPFRWQRDKIIDFIDEHRIERVVFLVGDMHCAYHASMLIGDGNRWMRRTVHELAGGPVNQLEYGRRSQFADIAGLTTRHRRRPYEVRMHQFHSGAGAMMHVEVSSAENHVPTVAWRVVRTITDPEVQPNLSKAGADRATQRIVDRAPIAGRINLWRRDGIEQLPTW